MAKRTLKFYHNGVENQKRSDIVIDLTRVSSAHIKKWTTSEKILAKAFLQDAESAFNLFKKTIEESIK